MINLNVQESEWKETENFATSVVNKSDELAGDLKDSVLGAKDLISDEARVLAPSVVDVFKESEKRLSSKKNVVGFLPNTILFYGLISLGAILTYKLIKKI